jgi:hypothetical protein
MALALNVFKTVTNTVQQSEQEIYTAPVGYTGVVLLAQVTNTHPSSQTINLTHRRRISGLDYDTEMLLDYPIPSSDTLNLLSGKLVLESGDKLVVNCSINNYLKLVISILETLN